MTDNNRDGMDGSMSQKERLSKASTQPKLSTAEPRVPHVLSTFLDLPCTCQVCPSSSSQVEVDQAVLLRVSTHVELKHFHLFLYSLQGGFISFKRFTYLFEKAEGEEKQRDLPFPGFFPNCRQWP